MKSSSINMKEQLKINPITSEVSKMKSEKSKTSKVCFIWFFAGIAIMSLGTVVIFWHTNLFRDTILAALEIKNGTQTFSWWERPPVSPVLKIRLFNYTNIEEYESGRASKLIVEELGPYIYRETMARVNVEFNENGTVSYQEKTSHVWIGGRPENEVLRVPNIPFIAAVNEVKESNSWWQIPVTVGISYFGEAKPFKILTVKEYLWGYSDRLIDSAMKIRSLTETLPYDKFGMLIARNGVSRDRFTVRTGAGDINKIGTYENMNGMTSRNVWGDDECDKIEGTDGSMFPPNLVRDSNSSLDIYAKDLCRKLPLRYHGIGSALDIPALRYKLSNDVFTSSNTTNTCFCKKTKGNNGEKILNCPPTGTFDMSSCTYGVPLIMSFPHFYNGDKKLFDHIEGLNPSRELHETYADIHPRLGIMIGGWSRFQVNVRVSVVDAVPVLDPLKEGMILPALWFEIGIDGMPETIVTALRQSYFTINTVESTLQWGSLLCTILSMFGMAYMMKKNKNNENNKWDGNYSAQNGC